MDPNFGNLCGFALKVFWFDRSRRIPSPRAATTTPAQPVVYSLDGLVMKRTSFKIRGMDCAEEIAALRHSVGRVEGVEQLVTFNGLRMLKAGHRM